MWIYMSVTLISSRSVCGSLEGMTPLEYWAHLSHRSWCLNTILLEKKSLSSESSQYLRLGWRKDKTSPLVSEREECSKNDRDTSEGHDCWHEGTGIGQIGDNLNMELNDNGVELTDYIRIATADWYKKGEGKAMLYIRITLVVFVPKYLRKGKGEN